MTAGDPLHAAMVEALREINAAYSGLPAGARPDAGWNAVDDALEIAFAGDQAKALAAIGEWRDYWCRLIEAAR